MTPSTEEVTYVLGCRLRVTPATNESSFHGWSIGPMYYATLVMAEAMGPTNASQITDLEPNNNNDLTPAYAIYENEVPMRVALFNYMDDPTGASTLSVTVSLAGGNLPQVKVKYLLAPSVVSKYNFTWAGQTFGGVYESDGRLKGDPDVKTVTCNGGNCIITVPAPSMALVFLSDQALQESDTGTTVTFPTTVFTKTLNTATVDASILATSNGHQGFTEGEGNGGSTSRSSGTNEATRRVVAVSMSFAWIVVFVSLLLLTNMGQPDLVHVMIEILEEHRTGFLAPLAAITGRELQLWPTYVPMVTKLCTTILLSSTVETVEGKYLDFRVRPIAWYRSLELG
ncbi:hypothetical protein C8J56DRAFT_1131767 [Mycena floridula]|nr:hypothetical protein C8J56DRAFT_1131767 [Mycena floridula]